MHRYRIEYFFNHRRFGFSNSITVDAADITTAADQAKALVLAHYASANWKASRFNFKTPLLLD